MKNSMFGAELMMLTWQASLDISCDSRFLSGFSCLQGSSFELTAVAGCVGGAGASSPVGDRVLSLRWLEGPFSQMRRVKPFITGGGTLVRTCL